MSLVNDLHGCLLLGIFHTRNTQHAASNLSLTLYTSKETTIAPTENIN
jgi:hypothetical protein